jgi:hypothetical protein
MAMKNLTQVRYCLLAALALAAATACAQQSAAGEAGATPTPLQAESSPQLARHDGTPHAVPHRPDGGAAARSGLSREQVRAEFLRARKNGSIPETEGDYDVAQTRRHVLEQRR